MARSRALVGPYEVHPDGPVLTAAGKPHAPLARAGHGDLVETPSGAGPEMVVPGTRETLAKLAARWHGDPTRHFPVVGVTGTNVGASSRRHSR